mgnify:CR=1 FL=1
MSQELLQYKKMKEITVKFISLVKEFSNFDSHSYVSRYMVDQLKIQNLMEKTHLSQGIKDHCHRFSDAQEMTNSTASSPTFCAILFMPFWKSEATYDSELGFDMRSSMTFSNSFRKEI